MVSSGAMILATTPAHAPGTVDVTVLEGDGQSATRLGGYTYVTPFIDAGTMDAGPGDAGQSDGGLSDGGQNDGGSIDAGPRDAGETDAGEGDSGWSDGGAAAKVYRAGCGCNASSALDGIWLVGAWGLRRRRGSGPSGSS
jgi:hypothetical protein